MLLVLLLTSSVLTATLTDEEASAQLGVPVTAAREEYGNVVATLSQEHCFGAVCAPAKAEVRAKTGGQQLTSVKSPRAFTAFGCLFAANDTLMLYLDPSTQIAHGTLSRPCAVGELLVTGEVRLKLDGDEVTGVLQGTLARATTLDGWAIPAGYSLRTLEGDDWSAEKTPAAASAAVMVHAEKTADVPSRATLVTMLHGVASQYGLVDPLTVGPLSFMGSVLVTVMPEGERHWMGALARPLKSDGLTVGRSAVVGWCERGGLQEATPASLTAGTTAVKGVRVEVVRAGPTVSGYKSEHCAGGPVRALRVELGTPCSCGGGFPQSPVSVEVRPEELAGASADRLVKAAAQVQAPCSCSSRSNVPRP
jgi:hypothetical protein